MDQKNIALITLSISMIITVIIVAFAFRWAPTEHGTAIDRWTGESTFGRSLTNYKHKKETNW